MVLKQHIHVPSANCISTYLNSPSIIMEYKQASEHFLQGAFLQFFTSCNGYVLSPLQRDTKTDLSAKAKAFTIDALLNTDKPRQAYSTVSMSDDSKDSFTEEIIISSELQNKKDSVKDLITYEEFSQGLQRAHVLKHDKYRPMVLQNEPKTYYPSELLNFSPMITGGFFRPVECYSPMSSEGQSTPAGLKSIYRTSVSLDSCHYSSLSKPESKPNLTSNRYLTSSLSTPESQPNLTSKEKQNIFMEGRKLLSTRRHERPHPYLSTKQNLTPMDKTDINFPSTPEQVPRVDNNRKSSKAKRNRTAFTPKQLQVLEAEFEKQQYLVGNERCDLADYLNLTVTQVKVWFQNRRIKWRKEQLEQGKHYQD